MTSAPDPVALLQDLIRCPSVTPAEGGALSLLEKLLGAAGFQCHRLTFSEEGTPDVENLFARLGTGSPHVCFAGHTDVVPPGEDRLWNHAPFAAEIEDGVIYGRGACDMKGSVAAFAAAAIGFAQRHGSDLPGSVSLLITGDEEGPAINGTVKVLAWLKEQGQVPDHALVGEPTCPDRLGDAVGWAAAAPSISASPPTACRATRPIRTRPTIPSRACPSHRPGGFGKAR